MRGFKWGGEEYDAAGVLRDPLQVGGDSIHRRDPNQEHRVDAIQAVIEGLWTSKVSAHDFDVCRQTSRIRIAHQRAYLKPCPRQLRQDLAAYVAGRTGDEDAFHNAHSMGIR